MEHDIGSRITIEPGKCGGKPLHSGEADARQRSAKVAGRGASFEEILRDYAFLEQADIVAAITYAAHQTDHVVLVT